jgi:hypothetical protein
VPDGGLFRAERFRDVHLYQGFADAVFDGRVPYRDFFMEYPPGALAVFLPPAAFGSSPAQTTTSSGNETADGFSQVPGPP